VVALTFDDGPDPVWTPRVLAELDRRGARATFFLDTTRALACPDTVAAIVAGGHEVGLHCVNHVRHSELSADEVTEEAERGLAALGALGLRPAAWRTPWGVETGATKRAAAAHGLRLWGWDRDSHDWRGEGCERMLSAIETEGGLGDGTVVLMHDAIGPGAQRDGCEETVKLTASLLDRAEAAGLRPVGVSALDSGDRLQRALERVAAVAAEGDRAPRFPAAAFAALAEAGVLIATVGSIRAEAPVGPEWELVRRVAAADASVGRILDGHLNAVERLEVAAAPELREAELAKLDDGERLLGVWGADPGPGEGSPARLVETGAGTVLRGAKTFCSGAGGVAAALVMVGSNDGTAPRLVLVECDERAELDRDWYRAAGLRASESHLVRFDDAPVVAVLGEPGELGREPWFSRDAMRTAATWAGMVDAAADAALAELAERRAGEPLAQLAAGRIEAARGTVDAWLGHAAQAVDSGDELWALSVRMRAEIDRAAKAVLETAAAACGSHPFVTGGDLDRGRRDLETFLLQHRLEPLLARSGAEILGSP
jgi:hypothetical protein